MQKYIIAVLFLVFTSCRSNHTSTAPIDPWHARYQHTSGKFYLLLNHFTDDAVAVDVLEQGQKKPRNIFFADIQADTAIFQDRTEPNCRYILKNTEKGIRTSLENFVQMEKIDIYPLYGVWNLVN